MGTEYNKILFSVLVLSTMLQLSFSHSQFGNKMNTSSPIPFGSYLYLPVEANVYPKGYFRTTMEIGNPPSVYYLDVDTGSNYTWIQCNTGPDAILYAGPHTPYTLNADSHIVLCDEPLCLDNRICKNENQDLCEYEVYYDDNTNSLGTFVTDTLSFKLNNQNDFKSTLVFGCGNSNKGSNGDNYVDGVLGLSSGESSIVAQLSRMGFNNTFGHCFSSKGDGFVFIGYRTVPSEMAWIEMSHDQLVHFVLGPVDLLVENDIVAQGTEVVFDAGSTFSYFNQEIYQSLLTLVNIGPIRVGLTRVEDGDYKVCWKGEEPISHIHDVEFAFDNLFLRFSNDAQFELQAQSYLFITSAGNVCLGIFNGQEEGLKVNIIGAIAFQDTFVIYDNEQKRVGWTPHQCTE